MFEPLGTMATVSTDINLYIYNNCLICLLHILYYVGSTVHSDGEYGKELKRRVKADWNRLLKVSGVMKSFSTDENKGVDDCSERK